MPPASGNWETTSPKTSATRNCPDPTMKIHQIAGGPPSERLNANSEYTPTKGEVGEAECEVGPQGHRPVEVLAGVTERHQMGFLGCGGRAGGHGVRCHVSRLSVSRSPCPSRRCPRGRRWVWFSAH